MSEPKSQLHAHVHKRFTEVFGAPTSSLGRDDHWALKPTERGPHASIINVLVNGTIEIPAVWVFDPHDPNDGVMRTSVRDREHVDEIIALIQERVKRGRDRMDRLKFPGA